MEESFGERTFIQNRSSRVDDEDAVILNAANRTLCRIIPRTTEQAELINNAMSSRPINLELEITASLLNDIKDCIEERPRRKRVRVGPSPMPGPKFRGPNSNHSQKSKATHLPALMLRIGSWELRATNEDDLVIKCYYAKKKLVWEILRNALKEKIEIEWSDIVGIRCTTMKENGLGVLQVELGQPPRFYKEIEPEPQKHTQWRDGMDFTEGEAYVHRKHIIVFGPGVLDKLYEKLITSDEHLFELSRRPFPTFRPPLFKLPADIHSLRSIFSHLRQSTGFQSYLTQHQTPQSYNQRPHEFNGSHHSNQMMYYGEVPMEVGAINNQISNGFHMHTESEPPTMMPSTVNQMSSSQQLHGKRFQDHSQQPLR